MAWTLETLYVSQTLETLLCQPNPPSTSKVGLNTLQTCINTHMGHHGPNLNYARCHVTYYWCRLMYMWSSDRLFGLLCLFINYLCIALKRLPSDVLKQVNICRFLLHFRWMCHHYILLFRLKVNSANWRIVGCYKELGCNITGKIGTTRGANTLWYQYHLLPDGSLLEVGTSKF